MFSMWCCAFDAPGALVALVALDSPSASDALVAPDAPNIRLLMYYSLI